MSITRRGLVLIGACASLSLSGCMTPRGKPGPEPEVVRPDSVHDFATLYKENCVACHGDAQHSGPAITLANPVYLAVAGEANIVEVLNHGRPGKLMPAFGTDGGGLLTEEQVQVLAKGLISNWGTADALSGGHAPGFKATQAAGAAGGQKIFANYCAECHGANGEGKSDQVKGSIVDPAYLGLISDQNLRSIVIAGMNPQMPAFRQYEHKAPLTDQDVTDVVAWITSHRTPAMSASESTPQSESMTSSKGASPPAKHETQKKQEPK